VPTIKGTQLYLNNTVISLDNSAFIANFGDARILVLGQHQQVSLYPDFLQRIDLLEQMINAETSNLPDGAIDLAALASAIQSGQNIEELLDPTSADGDISVTTFRVVDDATVYSTDSSGNGDTARSRLSVRSEFKAMAVTPSRRYRIITAQCRWRPTP
jgi:hypothetical protein